MASRTGTDVTRPGLSAQFWYGWRRSTYLSQLHDEVLQLHVVHMLGYRRSASAPAAVADMCSLAAFKAHSLPMSAALFSECTPLGS